jgi:hypothetical protein
MKIRREGTRLQGGYRYVRSAQDIGLVGTVSPGDGTFELTERVGDKVTGRFVGAIASISGALATWSSPDGSRTYPVVMEESWGDYPETIALGSGLTMYPQERQLTTDVCDVDVRYPQIRGAADKAAQAALNDLLRGERDKPRPCEAEVAPDDPEEAPPSRSFHEETYRLSTKTRGRFVGLEQSEFWYGAGAAHPNGGKTCSVLDTRTLTLVSLSDKLTLEGRAKLSEKVRAVFQGDSGDPGVGYIEASSIEVAPHTNICLTDTEIVVAFARYELGAYFLGEPEVPFPKAEVRPFFEKTDAMEALFSQ